MNLLTLTGRALPFLLFLAALIAAHFNGYNQAADKYEAQLARTNAAYLEASANMQQAMRAQEARHALAMSVLDEKHSKEMQNEITTRDRTIADLRAGTISVRKQFTCPSAAGREAGPAGAGTSLGDAAPAGGLQTEDAEFLLREAARADEVVVQLTACQAIVNGDRAGASGVPQP